MNPKIFLAFVGGLIIASGLTYIAMKPSPPPPAEKAQAPIAATPAATAPAEAQPPAPLPAEPVADSSVVHPAPHVAKPSPVVTRSSRGVSTSKPAGVSNAPAQGGAPAPAAQTPVQTAGNTPPPAATTSSSSSSTSSTSSAAETEPPPYHAPKIDIPPPPNKVVIPSGTLVTVRLSEKISTERNQPGDQFTAVLDQPLVVDGFVLAERGARTQGRIVELDRGGKVKGVATLSLELTQVRTSDGQNVKINTAAFKREAEASTRKDAAKVGVGAAIGAAIGAIAGGGKGAAIGAGVGGAAGAGDVLLTRGKAAELPVETRISFRLAEAVTVTEREK